MHIHKEASLQVAPEVFARLVAFTHYLCASIGAEEYADLEPETREFSRQLHDWLDHDWPFPAILNPEADDGDSV